MDNININYTVQESEVPKEIAALYRRTVGNVEDLLEQMADAEELLADGAANYYVVLGMLTEAKNKLISVDMNLADCQNIIAGYQRYLLDKMAAEQGQRQERQLELELEGDLPPKEPQDLGMSESKMTILEQDAEKISEAIEKIKKVSQKVANIAVTEVDGTK
tara:strand:+ start:257 stop:742 length:486 start_codon:yes stop_codon:yes gene_type:complete